MNSGRKVLRMIGIYVGAIIVVVVCSFSLFVDGLRFIQKHFRDPVG